MIGSGNSGWKLKGTATWARGSIQSEVQKEQNWAELPCSKARTVSHTQVRVKYPDIEMEAIIRDRFDSIRIQRGVLSDSSTRATTDGPSKGTMMLVNRPDRYHALSLNNQFSQQTGEMNRGWAGERIKARREEGMVIVK